MKILLIRPPVPRLTVGLKNIMICEPLELEYIAAGLEVEDEVQIFDMILERGLSRRLKEFNPDVVGTTCYINGVNEVIKICRTVKNWKPDCLTVVGGVHAACAPEDFADPSLDVIALGDGTRTLAEIVAAAKENRPFNEIPNLAFYAGENSVTRSPAQKYMVNPDELPFPRRDLVAHLQKKYYYLFHQPVAIMKTTWGCWYKCNFCFTWEITGGQVYSRSPESIADELEQIEAKEVYIVDDIFLIDRERLKSLAQILRERGIKKNYLVYGRADFISKNEDLIEEWAELGLKAVLIGLEAGTNHELESMNKKCTVDYNRQAIEVLRRNGIDTYGSLIPDPDYTPEDWKRLLDFIFETGLYYLNISPLTPLPGTSMYEKYKDKLTIPRSAHPLWDLSHVVLPTRMPLKKFYRAMLNVYVRTSLDLKRANKLTLRTRPPIFSYKYLRLWMGALKVIIQMLNAHKQHTGLSLNKAQSRGASLKTISKKEPQAGVALER